MRIWDYLPHPVEHPGWFAAVVTLGLAFAAGLTGRNEDMAIVLAAGAIGFAGVRYVMGIYDAATRPGFGALIVRLWLVCSIGWTYLAIYLYGPSPQTLEEGMRIYGPWVFGPLLRKASQIVLGNAEDDD
jgi:hypothetical protein